MKLRIHQLDPNRNLSGHEINWIVQAASSYIDNVLPLRSSYSIGGKTLSVPDLFSYYAIPANTGKSSYQTNFVFTTNSLTAPALASCKNANPGAFTSGCRKLGIINYDGKSSQFELTQIAKKYLLNKCLNESEYAIILLSKQWVEKDGSFHRPLLPVLWDIINDKNYNFLNDLNTPLDKTLAIQPAYDTIFKYLSGSAFNNVNDVVIPNRADILRNALLTAGLLSINSINCLEVPVNAIDIWKDIKGKESLFSNPVAYTDFYEHLGSTKTGLCEILQDQNLPIYSKLYPNIHKIISKELPSKDFNAPLQQIFYGAPGTGKSHKTNEVAEKYDGTIRTTFHPDSDYSTFVGAYKPVEIKEDLMQTVWDFASKSAISIPVVNNNGTKASKRSITYNFVKQAFTKAYLLAWKKYAEQNGGTRTVSTMNKLTTRVSHATRTTTGITYTFDESKVQLTSNEKNALINIDEFGYDLDGYTCLGELHKKIKVIITDKPTDEQLAQFQSKITQKEYDKIKKKKEKLDKERASADGQTRDILLKQLNAFGGILQRYQPDGSGNYVADFSNLLGLYSPEEKTVYLFMDNIRNWKGEENVELLSAVYVHEMLHAYFHSASHYVKEIEEAIVECLTLCFLKDYDDITATNLFKYYLKQVENKRYTPFGYYAFGHYLYEYSDVDWLTEYKGKHHRITPGSPLLDDYINSIKLYYPFDNEQETYKSLYKIFVDFVEKKVSCNDNNAQFLVVEEINRGNCAQIFGDLFQLLDRQNNGFSEYPIEADADLQKAIKKAFEEEEEYKISTPLDVDSVLPNYKSVHGGTLSRDIQDGHILLLPNNLYIWATMNTSDQSLFPMDSAFKRRWDWVYVPIAQGMKKDMNGKETEEPLGWQIEIDDKHELIDWWKFLQKVNAVIAKLTSSEDKQLGYFFCKPDEEDKKTISAKKFVGKVIFYLWNDILKDYAFDDPICKKGTDQKETLYFADFYIKQNELNIESLITFFENLDKEQPKIDKKDVTLLSELKKNGNNEIEGEDEEAPSAPKREDATSQPEETETENTEA